MALGGVAGGWNENVPSDSSNVGLGAGDIRSTKTQIRQPMDSEHIWTSSGDTYMGCHRLGSARAFYGTNSQVSSADTDGRLLIASDTTRLYNVGSTVTHFLGSRFAPEMHPVLVDRQAGGNSTMTSTLTQVQAFELGFGFIPAASSSTAITLQNTYVRAMALFSPNVGNTGLDGRSRPGINYGSALGYLTGATLTVTSLNSLGVQSNATPGGLSFTYFVAGYKAL